MVLETHLFNSLSILQSNSIETDAPRDTKHIIAQKLKQNPQALG